MRELDELDGYNYNFQFTVNGYGENWSPGFRISIDNANVHRNVRQDR